MKRILLSVILLVSMQAQGSWSCEEAKKTVCTAVAKTIEPLTTFAYENMTLAATSTAIIAYVAYTAGKFVHMPVYKPEDVQKVIVVAQAPTAAKIKTNNKN